MCREEERAQDAAAVGPASGRLLGLRFPEGDVVGVVVVVGVAASRPPAVVMIVKDKRVDC